ncbi:MAG: glycosyltransferase [Candidatus Kaelpia imicola]|nr:glycosyltransferase [Candidatus Kaelpia imicola]
MQNRTFSIVIPAYNEEDRIADTISEVIKTFDDIAPSHYEIVAVDDCSTDDTYKRLIGLKERYPQLVIARNNKNYGKGRALKKANRYCKGEYVIWIDADLDIHPLGIKTLYDIMRIDDADIAIGSKLHPNSVVNYPFRRRIFSYGYYVFISVLFNLPCHDTQTGLKIFKKEVLDKVFRRVLVKQFAFDLEVLVNANHLGYKITEGPIVLDTKREYNRIGLGSIIKTTQDTLAIFWRLRILKYYDRIDYYRRKGMAKELRRMRS